MKDVKHVNRYMYKCTFNAEWHCKKDKVTQLPDQVDYIKLVLRLSQMCKFKKVYGIC